MKYQDYALTKADGTYRITASTADIDRDGEVILPSAYKASLPKYLKNNPVILWAHDYKEKPVGRATAGRITEKSLELDIQFAPTAEGQEVKALYDGGFLNSFSVGFIPKNGKMDDERGAFCFDDVELLEVSCVPVPANASANMIRSAGMKGYDVAAMSKTLGIADDIPIDQWPVEFVENDAIIDDWILNDDDDDEAVSEVVEDDEVEKSAFDGLAEQFIRRNR